MRLHTRRTAILTLAIALICALEIEAQTILSVTDAPGRPVVAIFPDSGTAVQTLFPTNFTGSVRFEVSAFDPIRHRLFFLGELAGIEQLITVDVRQQTTTVTPIPVSGDYLFFEYDPAVDRIIAVTDAPGRPAVAINPTTGDVQQLLVTGYTGGVRFEVSTFDAANRRLFFVGDLGEGVQELIIVNLSNNTVVVRPIGTTQAIMFFEYDPTVDRLFGATGEPTFPVISIDPATGAVQMITTTGFAGGIRYEVSAFDVTTRRLFYLGDIAENPFLITVDLDTNLVTSQPIPTAGVYLFFQVANDAAAVPVLGPRLLLLLAALLAVLAVRAVRAHL